MNRQQRRAQARKPARKSVAFDRTEAIEAALAYIATSPTAIGATMVMPTGETLYISAAQARAWASAPSRKGDA